MGKQWKQWQTLYLGGSKIIADGDCSQEMKRRLPPGRKVMTNLDSIFKSRDITLPTKVHFSQSYSFSSGRVWMWELDYKESWALKNWCFWTVVLEKTLESLLDCKEIQPVHPKGDQSSVFIGRTDVEAETPNILATWCEELTHLKRPWCWERLRAGGEGDDRGWDGWWHHQFNGHEFGWTPAVGDGQGGLACCGSWGHKELDTTERLNWTGGIIYARCMHFYIQVEKQYHIHYFI